MKRRLLMWVIVINLIVIAISATTFAWFTSVKRTGHLRFRFGHIEYNLSNVNDAFVTSDVIVHGQELVKTPMYLTNLSSISSELRVKITMEYLINGTPTLIEITDDSIFAIEMIVEDGKGWQYIVGTDKNTGESIGYWYYTELESQGQETMGLIPTSTKEIQLFSSLMLDGNKTPVDFSGQNITIKILFQAKQGSNVTWDELGEADFRLN